LGLTTPSAATVWIIYLTSIPAFDLIYIDPSRKTAAMSKAILLTDYEPNVLKHGYIV
jgi:hypothetical protein